MTKLWIHVKPATFVGSICRYSLEAELASGQLGALDSCLNLAECNIASGRGVIGEGREAAVICGSELLNGQDRCCFKNTVTNLSRGFDHWIDRIDHTYKNSVVR